MLKLFFNRESAIVSVLEVVGVLLLGLFVWQGPWRVWRGIHLGALVLLALQYGFLRFCASVRWYPRQNGPAKHLGIELHFKKAFVPTAYILPITGGWLLAGMPPTLLYLANVLLGVIVPVNIILLYFHWRDRDATPVNYFSRSDVSARVTERQNNAPPLRQAFL